MQSSMIRFEIVCVHFGVIRQFMLINIIEMLNYYLVV